MQRFSAREHLLAIERTSERHEDRENFICLDRNERASQLSDAVYREILQHIKPRDLTAYPDAGPFVARLAGRVANRVPFALDTLPECFEDEPNDTPAKAQAVTLPIIVNGRIEPPGDIGDHQ